MILGIIQARMQSERLPGKSLMQIDGKPLLKHVIDRVVGTKDGTKEVPGVQSLDAVIVATYYGDNNGAIAGRCDDWGVRCYQYDGPANDVLGRFVACAKTVYQTNSATGERENVEYVLRVCGDAPLHDPQSSDELVATAFVCKAEYTAYELPGSKGKPTVVKPIGYFGEVVTMAALERADAELPKDAPEREHVTACMYSSDQSRFTRPFTCHFLPVPKWYAKEKLKHAAVDTRDDFERIRETIERE